MNQQMKHLLSANLLDVFFSEMKSWQPVKNLNVDVVLISESMNSEITQQIGFFFRGGEATRFSFRNLTNALIRPQPQNKNLNHYTIALLLEAADGDYHVLFYRAKVVQTEWFKPYIPHTESHELWPLSENDVSILTLNLPVKVENFFNRCVPCHTIRCSNHVF